MKGDRLRKKRDDLWHATEFCRMPRRESFSGLHIAGQLDLIQKKLDEIEGRNKSKRYYVKISIESF